MAVSRSRQSDLDRIAGLVVIQDAVRHRSDRGTVARRLRQDLALFLPRDAVGGHREAGVPGLAVETGVEVVVGVALPDDRGIQNIDRVPIARARQRDITGSARACQCQFTDGPPGCSGNVKSRYFPHAPSRPIRQQANQARNAEALHASSREPYLQPRALARLGVQHHVAAQRTHAPFDAHRSQPQQLQFIQRVAAAERESRCRCLPPGSRARYPTSRCSRPRASPTECFCTL